jgi:hypothetical protein
VSLPFRRIAVTRPPDSWFHGIAAALYRLYRQTLVDLGCEIFDVPLDPFLPPDVVRIAALITDLRAFRPELAFGLPQGVHALLCRLPTAHDGLRPNLFTDVLDIPLLCLWDHAPLQFADQLLAPGSDAPAIATLARVLTHPRLIHWSRDSGQTRIMRDLGLVLPDRVIHHLSPALPGFDPHPPAPSETGIAFIGHFYSTPPVYPDPTLADLAREIVDAWTAAGRPLWDILDERALNKDRTAFWRFALSLHEQAQTVHRLRMIAAAARPVTCYANPTAGAPPNAQIVPGEIPFGPQLAATMARHAVTIDASHPAFINGCGHKGVLGFASGGFMLVERKQDFVDAFGEAGEAVSYRNAEDLAAKLDHFLTDARHRGEVGDSIREQVDARFRAPDVLRTVLEQTAAHTDIPSPLRRPEPPSRPVVDLIRKFRCDPQWTGASIVDSPAGLLLTTAAEQWSYAASIRTPRRTRLLKQPHLRLVMQVEKGAIGVAQEIPGALKDEQIASVSASVVTIVLELPRKPVTIILRNTAPAVSRALRREHLQQRRRQQFKVIPHPHLQVQVVQPDHDLVDPADRENLPDTRCRRRGFEQHRYSRPPPDRAYERRDLFRCLEMRQQQRLCAAEEDPFDLLGRPGMNRINPCEELGPPHGRSNSSQIVERVRGDPGIQAGLPLRLPDPFEIHADAVDSGGIRFRGSFRVVGQQRQTKRIAEGHQRMSGTSAVSAGRRQLSGAA